MNLKLSDFNYVLPEELIAQYPASRRGESRLMVVERKNGCLDHKKFKDIVSFFNAGDVLVLNDTKVISARLNGRRASGGHVEVLLLKDLGNENYRALIKPLARLKLNEVIFFKNGFSCRLVDPKEKIVCFDPPGAKAVMKEIGALPLPPYVKREPALLDKKRYQTVFAVKEGAIAAPTAGLHFTKSMLSSIKRKKVSICFLTLHVNYATFSPVRCDDIALHKMEEEFVEIPAATVKMIREAKKRGSKIFAAGTTVCKALEDNFESILSEEKEKNISRMSSLFIYPPFKFQVTDRLITNFHLPSTTLLMLVSAFAGKDLILKAYEEAARNKYRFYSYGDATLII
ncbi:MAG TPA: tRNA preQ1(34) S-adenosylmethionine ribosyltransferase-isomerase QueA [Candidatus Omnitrophota bacterium]|nr:tRNA preQ1(34) S-adenosylmethionine ribosyltransferase-isomerase QueA [Candidatus Omnitrophota bacterium]